MNSNVYVPRWRRKRREWGLCIYCGERPARDGFSICAACSAERVGVYHQRIRDGECPKCGGEPRAGYTLCVKCAAAAARSQRKWRDKRRQERGRR